jgi:hypothetical protein
VIVPHDIDTQRIEAHGLDHEDAVLPVLAGEAGVVDLSGVDGQEGLQGEGEG